MNNNKVKENFSEETKRQFEYIEKAKEIVEELSKEAGHQLTCNVTTFGCQMNFKTVIEKAA